LDEITDWCGVELHQSGSNLHYLVADCVACVAHQQTIAHGLMGGWTLRCECALAVCCLKSPSPAKYSCSSALCATERVILLLSDQHCVLGVDTVCWECSRSFSLVGWLKTNTRPNTHITTGLCLLLDVGARNILQTLLPVFSGYEHPSSLSSSWRLSSTELFMAPHLSTCRISCSTLPIFRRDAVVASAHGLPVFSASARRDVLLSAISHLLLPALDFGTVYLLTSGLPRHSQHFVKSWKLIYIGNLTQTSFYNCVAVVVLEVTLT